MKYQIISIGLIIASLWIILFATGRFIGRYITSEEIACRMIENQIESGRCAETNDIEGLYIERRINGLKTSMLQIGIGLISLSIGMVLYFKRNSILGSWKQISIEVVINMFYWLVFTFLVGYMVSGGGTMFFSCTIDWIFLFLVSGLVGFYSGYTYIYKKQQDNRSRKQFIGYLIIFSVIGGAISYLPIAIGSAIASGNYFNIQLILALGFFSFISFIQVFMGFYGRKIIDKKIFNRVFVIKH